MPGDSDAGRMGEPVVPRGVNHVDSKLVYTGRGSLVIIGPLKNRDPYEK
jgi:hypothetical protein